MNLVLLNELAGETIVLIVVCSLPIIGAALVIGFIISLMQAVTQIQEQTLSFVPKTLGVYGIILLLGPWILNAIQEFLIHSWEKIPVLIR